MIHKLTVLTLTALVACAVSEPAKGKDAIAVAVNNDDSTDGVILTDTAPWARYGLWGGYGPFGRLAGYGPYGHLGGYGPRAYYGAGSALGLLNSGLYAPDARLLNPFGLGYLPGSVYGGFPGYGYGYGYGYPGIDLDLTSIDQTDVDINVAKGSIH